MSRALLELRSVSTGSSDLAANTSYTELVASDGSCARLTLSNVDGHGGKELQGSGGLDAGEPGRN